jgi:hypothetical protein
LRAILGSLRRTWQHLHPDDVPDLSLDVTPEPVWMTDIEVTSQVVRIDNRVVSGFTGRLRFVCDADTEIANAVDRLVTLAPFAGVAAYTTRGFGVTRPEATRPPAAAHTPHRQLAASSNTPMDPSVQPNHGMAPQRAPVRHAAPTPSGDNRPAPTDSRQQDLLPAGRADEELPMR